MDEQEWLSECDGTELLNRLNSEVTEREARLIAVACCRQIWHLLRDAERKGVEVAERYADGKATIRECERAEAVIQSVLRDDEDISQNAVAWTLTGPMDYGPLFFAYVVSHNAKRLVGDGGARFAFPVRCILGNPYRPVHFNLHWLSPTVIQLAAQIQEERRFDKLPILGDALEEAGCNSEPMLRHCRMEDEHVRGCWVLELLQRKAGVPGQESLSWLGRIGKWFGVR